MSEFKPGEHFHDHAPSEAPAPHIWHTLGYRRTVWEPGRQVLEWDATEDYAFPTASGHIIQGGMVATLLDTAMGGACWTLLDRSHVFLTADLRVEFLRPARPGLLRGDGRVIRRASRVMFCAADLFDTDDVLLASARCTQVLLPAGGPATR